MPVLKVWSGSAWVDAAGQSGTVSTATAPLVVAGANMSIPAATPAAPGHMTAAQADLVSALQRSNPGWPFIYNPLGSIGLVSLTGEYFFANARTITGGQERIDPAQPATWVQVHWTGAINVYYAPPGTGLITWTLGPQMVGYAGASQFIARNGEGVFAGLTSSIMAANATNEGGVWNRLNTGQPAALLAFYPGGEVYVYRAPAGANPIAWPAPSLLSGNADSGWLAVGSYGANWAAYAAPYQPYYRKLPNGMVIFRGLVQKFVAVAYPDVMFTMPAGFRPAAGTEPIFTGSNAVYNVSDMRVNGTSGAVTLFAGGSNLWTSLANISYLAE